MTKALEIYKRTSYYIVLMFSCILDSLVPNHENLHVQYHIPHIFVRQDLEL